MPEPILLTAGLVGLLGSLVKLNDLRGDFFEAKSEIDSLFREVDSLMNVLTKVQNLKHTPNSLSQDLLKILQDCNDTARKADILLLRSSFSPVPGLYWAYTGKKEVLQLCRELEAQKATINIILNLSSLHASNEINDKVNQILAEIKDLRQLLPGNKLTLQHCQSYAQSISRKSSVTYVDDEVRKHPIDPEWDLPLLKPSKGDNAFNKISNWQSRLHESDSVNLEGDICHRNEHNISVHYTLLRSLPDHGGGVSSVAFSKDGRRLLSGSWDGSLRLWDVETERTLQSIHGHNDDATSVVFVGDGSRLASASSDATIKFWDATSGSFLQRLNDHEDRVSGLAYAKDSRELASGSGDGTVRIWDIETGSSPRILYGEHGGVWSVAITDDGRQVVSGSGDGTINIWDLRVKTTVRTLEGHTDGVRSIAISRDKFASGSWDRTIKLWDIKTGSTTQTLQSHDDHITSVVYVGQKWLASGSGDDSAFKLWDTDTGRIAQTLHTGGGSVSSMAFSASHVGHLASGSGDRTVRLWSEVFEIA